MHSWLICRWIIFYNRKQSHKPARFERPRVHVEESCSTSMKNMVFYDGIDETDIAVSNSIRVRMPIMC